MNDDSTKQSWLTGRANLEEVRRLLFAELSRNERLEARAERLAGALRDAREYIVELADKDEIPEEWDITKRLDAALEQEPQE